MILLNADTPPTLSPLISIVIQQEKPKEEPPKQITWRDNPNGCTDNQWIASEEPFYCIDKSKPVSKTISAPKPARVAENGSQGLNGYVLNSCTGWVATHRYVPAGWGNASSWRNNALKAGWTVSTTPVVGAIGWAPGHVVYVIEVRQNTVLISERNYDYKGSIRTIEVPISKYQYIY